MGNGNSKSSKSSKVYHGQRAKVVSSELLPHHVPRVKTEPVVMVGFPSNEGSLRLKGHSQEAQQLGKKSSSLSSLDNDDTFTEFIRHVKYKARSSFSNISNSPPPEPEQEETKKNEDNEKDQFDDFIKAAKKKLKTTSRVGKSSSFRD